MAEHVLDDLAAWRAGALPAPRARAVEAHLAACPSCAAEARADEALDAALAGLAPDVAPGATDRARAALHTLGRTPPPTPLPWPLMAGVAFVLGLAASADLRPPPAPSPARDPLPNKLTPTDLRPREGTPDRRGAPSISKET